MNRGTAGDPAPRDSGDDLSDSESGSGSDDGLGAIARRVKADEKSQKETEDRYHADSVSRSGDSGVTTVSSTEVSILPVDGEPEEYSAPALPERVPTWPSHNFATTVA